MLNIKKLSNTLLGRIDVNNDAFTCCELNGNNVEHQHEIDSAYTQIIHALHDAGAKCIGVRKCKQNCVTPGWNDHVVELHLNARECYLIWRNNSKPRHGPEYEDMKLSRAIFKLAMRECRRNEELMKADAMTEKDTEPTIYCSQPCDTRSGIRAVKIKGVVTVYNKTMKRSCFILSYHIVIKDV